MKECEKLGSSAYVEIDINLSDCARCIFAALGNPDIEKTTHVNLIPEDRSTDLAHYESYAIRGDGASLTAKITSGVELTEDTRSVDSSVYFKLACVSQINPS